MYEANSHYIAILGFHLLWIECVLSEHIDNETAETSFSLTLRGHSNCAHAPEGKGFFLIHSILQYEFFQDNADSILKQNIVSTC